MLSTVVVTEDGKDVDPNVWTPAHAAVIKAAAKRPASLAHLRQPRNQKGAMPRRRPRLGSAKIGVLAAL
jgi:hypothetical protein